MFVDQTVQGVEVSGSNAGKQDFLTIFILWIFRVGQRRQIQRIGDSPGEGQEGDFFRNVLSAQTAEQF